MSAKIYPARPTFKFMPSIYGNIPEMRAYDLPGMKSVMAKELFPDLPDPIYAFPGDDLNLISEYTRKALENVDMSMIKPDTSCNIICSEHGFLIYGGLAYLQMLKELRKVVLERTGCLDLRLRVVMYRTPKEGQEVIEYYNLREEFDNKVDYVAAYDKAIPIKTRIGTFYGIEKAYDADKFIYAYYDDPREIYCHRMYRKSFKAFTMNMARYETRSVFHATFGNLYTFGPSAGVIPTAIFDSDFVQSKYTFACFLRSSPAGVYGVDADNDLYAIDDRIMYSSLKNYALVYQLLCSVKDWNMIVDGSRWAVYLQGMGLISGAIQKGFQDYFDLESPREPFTSTVNPNLRSVIVNQAWGGLAFPLGAQCPVMIVGDELENIYRYDPTNKPTLSLPKTKTVATLPQAVEMAKEVSGNDRFMLFDGSIGFINCTENVAEDLIALAPKIHDKVCNELYPMYLKQRNMPLPEGK